MQIGDPASYGGNSMSRENSKSKVSKGNSEPEETPSFVHLSRRTFLSRLGATGAAAAASPLFGLAQTQVKQEQAQTPVKVAGGIPITLRVNRQEHQVQIDARATLLYCLRV